ncbi:MAG: hypothetical protein GFH27_549285n256 [Chloroflexi bacterium AL-W]|nr:hypothetical protein [Chloroflexi bacterium AL-N1]NOK65768.1 hypothetical protein [Chloroflexi bacterium AL-N10]NOK74291.1 hypothetical protein [Chloroflexi bacterium AL-N5]NOK80801.1 hypothetical protein [Chloroflexi bacterium AL-W]NOK88549.1 hypothetical protein [Chloroflexi bacterium AL-N15]
MQDLSTLSTSSDTLGAPLSSAPESQNEARQRLAHTFRPGELVWLVREHYDAHSLAWDTDILRQGAEGRWMIQRYRFDVQAEVLYFLGESSLNDEEFRKARQTSDTFPKNPPAATTS